MNVTESIVRLARERPYAVAMIDGKRIVHFRDFEYSIGRAAIAFRRHGIAPGEVVAIAVANTVLHLVTVYALARLDAIQISLWPGETPAVNQTIVDRFNVGRIVADGGPIPDLHRPTLRVDLGWLEPNDPPAEETILPDRAEAPWRITLSSGSTGNPKGFFVTHAMTIEHLSRFGPGFDAIGDDVYLQLIDPAYPLGLRLSMHALADGFTVISAAGINSVDDFNKCMDRYQVTHVASTPSQIRAVLDHVSGDALRFPHLRYLSLTGSIVEEDLRHEVAEKLTPNLEIRYATNEVPGIVIAPPEIWRRYPATVGVPQRGAEIEIVDEADQELPTGKTGILRVRCGATPSEYIGDPDATERYFRGGWFYPGDLACFGDGGELYFKGRVDDLMNFKGNKILPTDIEDALVRHPVVIEAAAFPIPDNRHQDIPAAAVTVRGAVTPQELKQFCAERLGLSAPQIVGVVPAMPKNAMGKILKRELARMFQKKLPPA